METRKLFTVLGILIVLSITWTAFVKPEKERAAQFSNMVTTITASQGKQIDQNIEKPDAMTGIRQFWSYTGFRNLTTGHIAMLVIGLVFIFLAIKYEYEPLLLVPIGTGILIGNIPFFQDGDVNLQIGVYQQGSVLNYLYFGVLKGVYPPSDLPGSGRND